MTVLENPRPAPPLALQETVLSLLALGMGTIDAGNPWHAAHGAYYESVSPFLAKALTEIDYGLGLDCSHLFVRDIHDPEKLLLTTSSAKRTVFCRERFSVDSPFLAELAGDRERSELPLDRRRYQNDRLWELLWETMTVGPYAQPWSLVGFALRVASADGQNRETEPTGFLVFVGQQGWYSERSSDSRLHFSTLVRQFAFTTQAIRTMSRLATLSDWTSPQLTEEMATAGKLHGVLAPLQRLELKLGLAEKLVTRSRPHREILAGFQKMRTEIFEVQRCAKDFLDTKALARPGQTRIILSREQYARPDEVVPAAIEDLRELAEREKKEFMFRSADLPPLAISNTDFELIVENLLHNAVKYGAPDTKIKVTCEQRGPKALLDVTSCGICIPPAERERIFEPGYRTAEASKVEYVAAGLGLFTARRAAERWGGHLFLHASQLEADAWRSDECRNVFRLEVPY